MAQGNKIGSYQTLASFTVNVPYAQSKRYGTTQSSTTFTVGYEYAGANFYKSASRPPKIRILAAVKPVVAATGLPNANNDTYVAYQMYDYNTSSWRGPACGRAVDGATTYTNYFLVTLDRFGQSVGNMYAGTGYSATTFTAPTVVTGVGVYANTVAYNNGSASATATANHADSVWTYGGANSGYNVASIHFNGFFYFDSGYSGYVSGTYCFYTLRQYPVGASASNKTFRHTYDRTTYTSGTYPYLTQNKFTSEWRYAPLCDVTRALGYTPLVKQFGNAGGVKVYTGPSNPAQAFPGNLYSITDVYSFSSSNTPSAFFSGERLLYTDPQGITPAPAGWYGTQSENSYQYWDGSAWNVATYATYSVSSYTAYSFGANSATGDGACGFNTTSFTLYSSNLTNWYTDSGGTTPFSGNNKWYQELGSHIAYQISPVGNTMATYNCPPPRTTLSLVGPFPNNMMACMEGSRSPQPPTTAYLDGSAGIVYTAATGSNTFSGMEQSWYDQNSNTSYAINNGGVVYDTTPC